jgi:transcriptional regulator with XRE-family HTH domain
MCIVSLMKKAAPTRTPLGVAVDGDAVRNARKRLGYTITAMAPQVGVSVGYLSQIERGHRPNVSPPTFKRLATALGLDEKPERIMKRRRTAV